MVVIGVVPLISMNFSTDVSLKDIKSGIINSIYMYLYIDISLKVLGTCAAMQSFSECSSGALVYTLPFGRSGYTNSGRRILVHRPILRHRRQLHKGSSSVDACTILIANADFQAWLWVVL